MLDHHIQRSLVYKLALTQRLRFSELKPPEVENKLFTYHLKKVVHAGYVTKNNNGMYELTPEGRRLGIHVLDNVGTLFDRAYSVLFMIVRRESDNSWLLYKRKSHPLLNRVGFMHTNPNALESSTLTAQKVLLEKTGLNGTFRILGAGFFRIYEEEKLESFTNFSLLVCEDATGELNVTDMIAEYYWVDSIDLSDASLLPNMAALVKKYQAGELFFLEESIQV